MDTTITPSVVSTTIDAVTVHRNGALVVRRGEIARPGVVEVRGLPLLFSSDSLRVRPAHGAVSALEETVRLESLPAPVPPSEEERERLLLDLARTDDELRLVDALLAAVRASRPELLESKTLEPRLADARAWVEVLAASRDEAARLAQRRLDLAKKRRDLEHERRRLDERTRALVEPVAPRVLRGVQFTADAPGPFTLEYFTTAARWVPSYALHLTSSSSSSAAAARGAHARLVTAALVAQASGEDWSGVALSVSTADLSRETTLPTLASWRIGRAQPQAPRGFRPLPSDLPALFAGYDQGPRRPAPPTGAIAPGAKAPLPPPPPRAARPQAPATRAEYAAAAGVDLLADDDAPEHDFDDEKTDAGLDSAEAIEFERERSSNARPSLSASLAFEEAATDPESAPLRKRAPGAPPMAQAMMAPAPAVAAKRGGFGFGGGGPGGGGASRADEDVVQRAPAELPPRWRTSSLRMAGPDEPQRGSLVPLDPIARLAWLLEAHDVDAPDGARARAELMRAVQALVEAQQRMERAPLPRGTSLLLGSSFHSVLRAAAATDVPGDGTYYRVEVRVDEGPAQIEHRCVPRAAHDVWRMCRLDAALASKGPLPPGPLAVYEDGAFKVNARLDLPAPSQPPPGQSTAGARAPGIDLNLGVDPDVRVLARTVHVRQAEKGIMSQTSRVEHDVEVELRSTRKEPARVVVHDRLPVPADNVKDVSVHVLEEKPPLARTNKDAAGRDVPGAFEWRVTLMPGDTQRLALKYAIDLPAKAELEGGNRRE